MGRRRTARGSATVWRRLGIAAAIAALPLPSPRRHPHSDPYSVLVFTKNATVGRCRGRRRPAGIDARPRATFDVLRRRGEVHRRGPRALQGRRVPQHDRRRPLDAAQRDGVREVLQAGRRLPRHRLGDRDRARLAVLHRHPRHPLDGHTTDAVQATIKVADRGHAAAARCCRSTGTRTDRWYNFAANVARRLARHRHRRRREDLQPGGNTMTACRRPHGRRPPDRLVQGLPGRPLLLHRGRQHRRGVRRGAVPRAPRRRGPAGPPARPTRSTATAARPCSPTIQQTKISAPPNLNEPIGFDQLPDGRDHPDGPRGPGAPAQPGHGHLAGHREHRRPLPLTTVYTNSEDGLYGPGGRQQLRHQQVGVPVLRAADRPVKLCDGTIADATTPTGSAPTVAADPCVWRDTLGGLLPALALQVRRWRRRRRWTSRPSRRSCRSTSTAVRAATSRATSTSTRTTTCGWSRVTTRPPAAATPAASVPSTTRRPTRPRPSASPTPPAAPSR